LQNVETELEAQKKRLHHMNKFLETRKPKKTEYMEMDIETRKKKDLYLEKKTEYLRVQTEFLHKQGEFQQKQIDFLEEQRKLLKKQGNLVKKHSEHLDHCRKVNALAMTALSQCMDHCVKGFTFVEQKNGGKQPHKQIEAVTKAVVKVIAGIDQVAAMVGNPTYSELTKNGKLSTKEAIDEALEK